MTAGRSTRAVVGRLVRAGFLTCLAAVAAVGCGGGGGGDDTASPSDVGDERSASESTDTTTAEEQTDDVADDGGSVDLTDACSVLTAQEAAEIAGEPMPVEHRQDVDMTAYYQQLAQLAGSDVQLAGSSEWCIRATAGIDPTAESQDMPDGAVGLTPVVATLTTGTFDLDILLANGLTDVSDEFGLPATLEILPGDDVLVRITLIPDDTHLVAIVGGKGGSSEEEARELVTAAAELVAAKLR